MPLSNLLRINVLFARVHHAIRILIWKRRFFPPVCNLPENDDISGVYQTDLYASGIVTNRIHWCLVGWNHGQCLCFSRRISFMQRDP